MDDETLEKISKPIFVRRCYFGFVYRDRISVGEFQDVIHVHDADGDGDHTIELP
ncbi:MAG: hypothetical protein LBJ67_02680 [Planctomycetaceae bacterium]|nr:hypothetical protein [Planctomycetaceae bacterium]